VRAHTQQVDAECRAMQRHCELVSEQAAIEAQLTELQHHKSVLKTVQNVTVNLTKARARAKAVAAAINHEGAPHPTFARASHNVAMVAALLDTFHVPSVMGWTRCTAS
jgi:hypothetical protein